MKLTKNQNDRIEKSLEKFKTVVSIDTVIPYEKNPRNNDEAVSGVAASLRDFGWKQAIVVDSNMVIICGHTRLKAAKENGLVKVPVYIADDLSPEQTKAYRLADNRTGEIATWNLDLLQIEMDELSELGFKMDDYGFSDLELSQIIGENDPVKQGKTDPDAVPETPDDPVSKRGTVYQLGNHRVMCGDSTAKDDLIKLMNGQLADLWLTDPPYNVAYESANGLKIQNDNMSVTEFDKFLTSAFVLASHTLKPGASFYIFHSDNFGNSFRNSVIAAGLTLRQCLMWVKNGFILGRQDYQWAHEPCLYGWKDGASHKWYGDRKQSTVINVPDCPFILREDGKYQLKVGNRIYSIAADAVCIEEATTVVECPKPKRNDIHPTMKPVELLIKLLKHSCKRGDVIVDTFGGSGSTLIAAEQTGRTAFLMELDERYVDAIRKRYAEFRYGEECDWEKLTPAEQ